MGRPTKEEKLKREKLLKYFKRDSEIYKSFEEVTKDLSKERMIYTFLDACSIRSTCNNIGGICCTFNDDPNNNDGWDDLWETVTPYQELMNIDEVKHDYYSSILAYAKSSLYATKWKSDYRAYQMIDEVVLVELFGETRVKELDNRGYPHYLLPLLRKLTEDEKIVLKEHIKINSFGTKTIIMREYTNKLKYMKIGEASLLVELDFTKPLNELQEYIKHLHHEYEKNKISDVFDYLNIKRNHPTLSEHDIYRTNGHKPFNAVLADKLFIYDSLKNGLKFVDITKEINKYTKKFSDDKIAKKTFDNYSNFIINFIDNEEFIKFRNGVN